MIIGTALNKNAHCYCLKKLKTNWLVGLLATTLFAQLTMVGHRLPKLVKEPIGEFPSGIHAAVCMTTNIQLPGVARQDCLIKYKRAPCSQFIVTS